MPNRELEMLIKLSCFFFRSAMAFGNIGTVLIIFAVSGIVMVTADDETVAMQTMNDTSEFE